MIWVANQLVGCRFENNPDNANGDVFTEIGSVSYRDGASGREVDLSASGALIEMVDENYVGSQLHGAGAVTIAAWVEVTTIAPDRQTIVSIPNHFPSSGAGIIMEIRDNNGLEIRGRSRGGISDPNQNLRVQDVFAVGEKYYCVGVWNFANKELILYVNGEEIGRETNISWPTSTYSHTSGDTPHPCTIGAHFARFNAPRYFSGYIDELSIYRTGLNFFDIKRIMHGLHPLNG